MGDIASYKTSELASFKGKSSPAALLHIDDYTVLFSFKTSAVALDIRTGGRCLSLSGTRLSTTWCTTGPTTLLGFPTKPWTLSASHRLGKRAPASSRSKPREIVLPWIGCARGLPRSPNACHRRDRREQRTQHTQTMNIL